MTADPSLFDDAETLSTLEALNDIADTVEAIVIALAASRNRTPIWRCLTNMRITPRPCRMKLR